MYKLVKWIYELAYRRGWDDAKRDTRNEAEMAQRLREAFDKQESL